MASSSFEAHVQLLACRSSVELRIDKLTSRLVSSTVRSISPKRLAEGRQSTCANSLVCSVVLVNKVVYSTSSIHVRCYNVM